MDTTIERNEPKQREDVEVETPPKAAGTCSTCLMHHMKQHVSELVDRFGALEMLNCCVDCSLLLG